MFFSSRWKNGGRVNNCFPPAFLNFFGAFLILFFGKNLVIFLLKFMFKIMFPVYLLFPPPSFFPYLIPYPPYHHPPECLPFMSTVYPFSACRFQCVCLSESKFALIYPSMHLSFISLVFLFTSILLFISCI